MKNNPLCPNSILNFHISYTNTLKTEREKCDGNLAQGLILPSAKTEKNPVFCIYREI
jgi:hypothetical protein